jgi:hypothetical protein
MNQATPLVWTGVGLFLVFCALTYTSSWLRGPRWFAATVCFLGATLLAFFYEGLVTDTGLTFWLTLSMLLVSFLLVFYVVGARFLTNTRLLDLKYHAPADVNRYISERQLTGPLAATLRILPTVVALSVGAWILIVIGKQFGLGT